MKNVKKYVKNKHIEQKITINTELDGEKRFRKKKYILSTVEKKIGIQVGSNSKHLS